MELFRTPVVWLDEIDSTNTEARRWADRGEYGPVWIAAHRQTAGRGRRGRDWIDPAGNLAATCLVHTLAGPGEAAQLSFAAALAVADLFDAYLPSEKTQLKWPNDPLIDGAKAGGLLLESGAAKGGGLWLAVGVGINLAAAPVVEDRAVTCLAAHMAGPAPSPDEALDKLSLAFARWMAIWRDQGFGAIAKAWTARAHGLGEACTARLETEVVEGVAEGLEADGALRLRLADGAVRRITAGDVYF